MCNPRHFYMGSWCKTSSSGIYFQTESSYNDWVRIPQSRHFRILCDLLPFSSCLSHCLPYTSRILKALHLAVPTIYFRRWMTAENKLPTSEKRSCRITYSLPSLSVPLPKPCSELLMQFQRSGFLQFSNLHILWKYCFGVFLLIHIYNLTYAQHAFHLVPYFPSDHHLFLPQLSHDILSDHQYHTNFVCYWVHLRF